MTLELILATKPGLPTACRIDLSGSERNSFQPTSAYGDTFAFKVSKLPPYEHGVFIGKKESGNFKIVLTLDAILAELPKAIKLARNNPVIVPDNQKTVQLLEEIDTAVADILQISDDATINIFPEPTQDYELFVTRMLRPFDRILCSSTYSDFEHNFKAYKRECEKVWNVLAMMSRLLAYPPAIKFLLTFNNEFPVQGRKIAPALEFLKDNHVLFTFALRNILARLAFHTEFTLEIVRYMRGIIEGPADKLKFAWKHGTQSPFEAFALIGFNRLLSPNNMIGASLSSDIDYKLLFQPNVIMKRYGRGSVALSPEDVKKFEEGLNKFQSKDLKSKFDKEANMLLEVQKFTTKSLPLLETQIIQEEPEKNFLSSIYYNHVYITGSESLYKEFKKLLHDNKAALKIATRTWTQYLGETDKGSIKIIQNLDKLYRVIEAVARYLCEENIPLPGLVPDIIDMTLSECKHYPNLEKRRFLNESRASLWTFNALVSPMTLYEVLNIKIRKGEKLADILGNAQKLRSILDATDLYKYLSYGERLITIAKVMKGLIDENDNRYNPEFASLCLKQIGSPLATEREWSYSLKYAGCRLNDFFDAVPYAEYENDPNNSHEALYNSVKQIAEAINNFSLQMQNNIYLLASNPRPTSGNKPLSHETIDSLYSRLSKERFEEMIERADIVGIKKDINHLCSVLGNSRHESLGQNVDTAITNILGNADNPFQFFSHLFNLVVESAEKLRENLN